MTLIRRHFLPLLLAGLLPQAGFAADPAPSATPAAPAHVDIGCYVDNLRNFDYIGGIFRSDLYLWVTSPTAEPVHLDNVDFVRGRSTWNSPTVKIDSGGMHYECRRYMVEINHDWDIARFPFDVQRLRIMVEDLDSSTKELEFHADPESTFSPNCIPADWVMKSQKVYVKTGKYSTNFGAPNDGSQSSEYSRMVIEVLLVRHAIPLFLKLVSGAFAAFLAICISFWLPTEVPAYVSARIGLIVGCIFGTIINQRVVEAVIGRSSYVTHIDAIHIVTLIACIIAGVMTLVSGSMSARQKAAEAKRMDRLAFAILLTVYVIFNVTLVSFDCWHIASVTQ